MIGTGATAIQCVPFLGERARALYVFQRTPSPVGLRGNTPADPQGAHSLESGRQRAGRENFANVQVYICGLSGTPHAPEKRRPRGWLANLAAQPRRQFCVKESVQVRLHGRARIVKDRAVHRLVPPAGPHPDHLIDNAPQVAVPLEGRCHAGDAQPCGCRAAP